MSRSLILFVSMTFSLSALAADWTCVAKGSFDSCRNSVVSYCTPTIVVKTVAAAVKAEASDAALSSCQTALDGKVNTAGFGVTIKNLDSCDITSCVNGSGGNDGSGDEGGVDGGGVDGNGGDDGNGNGGGSCRSVEFDIEKRMISDSFRSFKKAIKQARGVVKREGSAEISSAVVAVTKAEVTNAAKGIGRIGDAIFVDCSVAPACRLSGNGGIAAEARKSGKRATRSAVSGLNRIANTQVQTANVKAAYDNLVSALDEVPGNSAVCR
jgi:hypothetical protein